jgi:hypothetical protein
MEHIIVNEKSKSNSISNPHSNILNEVVQGVHFNAFVESQKIGYKSDGSFKKKGITDWGAANLREETEHILARCNPHDAVNNVETTHLVVGYVQSGKTMSFTGLTALALDNHYRIIIYLAGSKNNLLEQTCKRLKKDLITGDVNNRDVFKIHKSPSIDDIDQIVGNLYQHKAILLMPILKHYKHIERLTTLFKESEVINALGNETVLIIDDEADQASLNSFGRKNSKKSDEEEEEKSHTYDEILKLRAVLPGNSYIQYTATPQANILISIKDMLSPKTHTLLTPGEGYIGGLLYFGRGKNHELFQGRLIKTIPENEVFHKTRNLLTRMPKSLKDALMLHILAVVLVVKYYHKDGIDFLSMMVHPATEKKHNLTFKKWIDNQLKNWRKYIMKDEGNDDRIDMIKRFKELFPEAIKFYAEDEQPSFDEVLPFIKEVLCSWKVYLVNTDKDAQTEIEWDEYCMHVLVGAEMLNRGFTVENLATTYMPRYSTGPSNADTIQQRCRFFGYKRDYIESCRVFLPAVSMNDYVDYINHEEELRSTLGSCDSLDAAERKILLSPTMRATRANVLPISVVNSKLVGHKEMRAYESKARIESNALLSKKFIQSHEANVDYIYDYGTDDRCHRRFKISVDDAIEFLNDFQFGNYKDASLKSATIRYLRYLSDKEEDAIKDVYFIQMAYKNEESGLRNRDFDYKNSKLSVPLATGRSSAGVAVYPGDTKIVMDNFVTIQLYHINLKGAPLNFAHDAYSIAINYPESLAATYVQSETVNQADDDIEDEE